MMLRETRLGMGDVPDNIAGEPLAIGRYLLSGNEFLVRQTHFACHYRQGEGVTAWLADPAARGDMELMLAGSVRAAIACINGLFPFHASAVALNGRVFAFTGPSGAGSPPW